MYSIRWEAGRTYRNIRIRLIICFLSSIFVIFTSLTFFQSLSAGNTVEKPVPAANDNPAEIMPSPAVNDNPDDITSDTDSSPAIVDGNQAPASGLTKNQKYYKQLVSPGSTNVLIGSTATMFAFDTILIVNIDKAAGSIRLINLPRDIYIDYTDETLNDFYEKKPERVGEPGLFKINAAPSIGRDMKYKRNVGRFGKPYMDFLCDIVDEVFSIHIDDYIYVKTAGVRNIIDYFGGVDINVPILMNYSDPTQDLEIYLEPGYRHLNGLQAEGFLRFRQGYDENGVFQDRYGDLFRKDNQDKFVKAFIEQKITLSNLSKLSKISDVIAQNVETSIAGWDDIVAYGSLAEEAVKNHYKIESVELECKVKTINGSSYVLIQQ